VASWQHASWLWDVKLGPMIAVGYNFFHISVHVKADVLHLVCSIVLHLVCSIVLHALSLLNDCLISLLLLSRCSEPAQLL
jgi:hypothetical protein